MISRMSFYVFLWIINSAAVGDTNTILLTLPTFLVCLFNIHRIRNSYLTVADMFWFVYFVFFVIGPIQSLSDNYFRKGGPVFGVYFTNGEILSAAAIAFLFALSATIAGLLSDRITPPSSHQTKRCVIDSGILVPLSIIAVISFAAFVIFSGGLGNVLASRSQRDGEGVSLLRVFALASLIISTLFSIAILMAGTQKGRSPGLFGVVVVVGSLMLLAIAQNPYNTPRYFLIQAWLPVILLFLKGRLKALPFYIACLAGMLVVLPVLSVTSRFGTGIIEAMRNIDMREDFFRIPYVDGFDMLVYEIKYLGYIGFSYGERVLGAILFFVPRALWAGKSQLLALQMGDELTAMDVAGTDNLSLFFGGEFYADFGFLGVVIFGFIFSWIYLRFIHNKRILVNGLPLREFIIISAVPIIVRGPIGANAPLIVVTLAFLFLYLHVFAHSRKVVRRGAVLSAGRP